VRRSASPARECRTGLHRVSLGTSKRGKGSRNAPHRALVALVGVGRRPHCVGGAREGVVPGGDRASERLEPEGIAIVGSIPTGAVYRGDLRTGKGATLVPGAPGRAAIGVQHDRGRLFVAGGATGKCFVYDARSGSLLRELQLATGAGATFVNDVVVTKRAAYFTDSNRAVLYRVALSANGVPAASSRAIPLTGDFQLVAGFNLNGIDATPDGKTLVVVQSATGTLFTVDAATGTTREIGLGGASVPNGDGLLLHGRTLYVVQNQLNRIAVVSLAKGFDSGRITRTIVDPDLDVPTTVDRFGDRLYAVNARFGTAPGPSTSYSVVQLRR
jgi:sugar lactone lactonase YvrE